jgi:hypothetical protein
MDKQYKIISLNINEDDKTGIEVLLAELTLIETQTDESYSFTEFVFSNKELFVFSSNSKIAKYLLKNPENPKTLDLSDFQKGKLFLSQGLVEAYFHIEYVHLKNKMKPVEDSDFSYFNDDPKQLIADYYYYELTDNKQYDFSGNIINTIQEIKVEIDQIKAANGKIDWYYYYLAGCLTRLREFEEAKKYYLLCAREETPRKADALFALACLKIKRKEDGENELKQAIHLYEKEESKYSRFAKSVLNPPNKIPKRKLFTFAVEKNNDRISIKKVEDEFALMEVHMAFTEINNFIERELRYAPLINRSNGYFKIEVVFVKEVEEPDDYVISCEILGFNFDEIRKMIKPM